jgi:hypothetical protein
VFSVLIIGEESNLTQYDVPLVTRCVGLDGIDYIPETTVLV